MRRRSSFLLGLPLALGLTASCANPVHSDAVDALGPEVGERPGPTHRAGQPCMTCHGGDGPGPDFAVAGTVYEVRDGATALEGVQVVLSDSAGQTQTLVSNQVGNFYMRAQEWTPTYPMFAKLEYQGTEKPMTTRIGRTGGCADCHRSGVAKKMPGVYLREQ